jgi:hypothetical protein
MPAARRDHGQHGAGDSGVIADHAGGLSRYLTDGVTLYRVGGILGNPGQFVALENCHTLEVILLPLKELEVRRLCAVIPASADSGRERFVG